MRADLTLAWQTQANMMQPVDDLNLIRRMQAGDDDAVRDLDMLARRVLARLQRQLGLVHQLPGDQSEQRHHEGQRDDRRLGAEAQPAEQAHAGRPDPVVGEEAGVAAGGGTGRRRHGALDGHHGHGLKGC